MDISFSEKTEIERKLDTADIVAEWLSTYKMIKIAPLFEPLLEFSNGLNEALLLYSKELNVILGVVYRQPTNRIHKSEGPEFIQMLASITSKIDTISNCTPDIYICGDFNIPHTFTNDTYTQTTSCDNQL